MLMNLYLFTSYNSKKEKEKKNSPAKAELYYDKKNILMHFHASFRYIATYYIV